jgi:tetratricopeptide (TPR) repeat protein
MISYFEALQSRRLLAPLVVAGLVVLVYVNSIDNSFHYDDLHVLVENPHIEDVSLIPSFFTDPALFSRDADKAMYRPLLLASFALNYAWSDRQVYSYHVVNILMHATTSLLVWFLLKALRVNSSFRLVGTLLFALHPIATEPVNYISSRSELMVGLFVVASFWLYERSWASGWAALVGSVLCFALGLLAKSVGIALPALIFARDLSAGRSITKAWPRYVPYCICSVVYIVLMSSFLRKAVLDAPVRSWDVQLETQIKAWVYYVKLLCFPMGLNVHHQFFESELVPLALLFFLCLLSFAVAVAAPGVQRGVRLFGLFWFAITLAPASVVPLYVLVNDHRLYLPLIGLIIIGSSIPSSQLRRLQMPLIVLVVLLGLLVVRRNGIWENEHTLWSDAARKSPHPLVPVAYVHLGNYAKDEGRLAEAVSYFEQALEIDPDHTAALNNLATVFDAMGDQEQSIAIYERLLHQKKDAMEVRYNLARALQQSGHGKRARGVYLTIPDTSVHFELVANNLGTLHETEARADSALFYYGRALAVNPATKDAVENFNRLAQQLLQTGRDADVESVCASLLAGYAPTAEAQFFRSVALFQQRRYGESIEQNHRLVADFPTFEL